MSRKLEDYFDQIVVTDFTPESAEKFRKAVIEESLVNEKLPITIYIDSHGGDVESLTTMVEVLESVPNPLHTVCVGKAMSAGAILLAFGDVRYCGEYSTVMVHEFSGGAMGHTDDVINEAKELKRLNTLWYDRMAKWCGLKDYKDFKAKLKNVLGRELYLDANRAREFGIVDHVGVPKVSLKSRKVRNRRRK